MKALTFLEWLDKRQTRLAEELKPHRNNNELELYNTYALDVLHVSHFYNQPFTVGMLINKEMKHYLSFPKVVRNIWREHESLRLFEGWGENTCYDVIHGGSKVASNEYKLMYCGEFVMAFETLNDFITLCNLEGIELQFNKSNETIRNLFGKE